MVSFLRDQLHSGEHHHVDIGVVRGSWGHMPYMFHRYLSRTEWYNVMCHTTPLAARMWACASLEVSVCTATTHVIIGASLCLPQCSEASSVWLIKNHDGTLQPVTHTPVAVLGTMQVCSCCAKLLVGRKHTKSCGRCKIDRYCNRDCQEAHWGEHKPLCITIPPPPGKVCAHLC